MIKKLQRKFILITMTSLFLVMLVLIGLINGINIYQTQREINDKIRMISENQGKFPEFKKDDMPRGGGPVFGFEMNPETRFSTRYFVVEFHADGSIRQSDISHIAALTSGEAQEYAAAVINSGRESGYRDIYRYQVVEQTGGYMVIFLDCRLQLQTAGRFLAISCIVGLATLVLMFLLISVLSKQAIKPFIDNAEKQKLFITDAGHEIKTPLAIISANTDVLELTGGNNEWIASIRNQIIRLDKLVKNFLMLSKTEEDFKLVFAEFDLSRTVSEIAGSFTAIAETRKQRLRLDIRQGIKYHGDQSSIEQLVSTLMDNATKYSNEEGHIRLSLTMAKKGPRLEVYNTVEKLGTDNLEKLFDRFYRTDSSRSRETGGYGIGLSIARSIAEAHQGRISVKSEDGTSICFIIQL